MFKRQTGWDRHFNPRSRVGNDAFRCRLISLSEISIHVPAWGTTIDCKNQCLLYEISIHVPAWGTTMFPVCMEVRRSHFNPRSRVGNDGPRDSSSDNSGISIHVPAWGTTINKLTKDSILDISIHVPAWGTTSMMLNISS